MATVRPIERQKRRYDELRRMEMEWGGLSRVDGSAKFCFGKTRCVTSVSGPIEVRLNAELPSKATLEVSMRSLAGVAATAEKRYSRDIRDILEQVLILSHHPRTLVQVVIQANSTTATPQWNKREDLVATESRGMSPALLAASINATSLALLNAASVPLRGILCAAAVGKIPQGMATRADGGPLALDPEEGEYEEGYVICAMLYGATETPEVIWVQSEGLHNEDEYTQALELAEKGANDVFAFLKKEIGDVLSGGKTGADSTKMEIS
ncbi:exosome non-catalytic core subunit rrp46 [Tulasnella sp. 419]|nr:exosome non-catalytic core subunit rrp46 [Tulasnella sp. 419]